MSKMLLAAGLLASTAQFAFAQTWQASLQKDKGASWEPVNGAVGYGIGFMERQCVTWFELKRPSPYAVKLTSPEGSESIHLCADVRAEKQKQRSK